ncbi:DUF998 domain-containing protein [Thermococcus sp.]|uniref:DUF998 domain-containing protein n=1 Tax=Thermococcus sp. TaxID=35749 RepID=UPI002611C1E5|nr:DUF998 domain-containing protein [Thermococcus sp.]
MRKSQLYAGLLAPIVAFLGIGVAVHINRSWWRLTENAISDLGKLGLPHNWVLNISLIATAVLGVYYATGLLERAKNGIERAGIWTFIIGLVFLATIGLFPEGTAPHYYVSWAFFITAGLGVLITGLGALTSGDRAFGWFSVILFLTGWVLATWARGHFRGVAVAELIGAVTISIWHYTLLLLVAKDVQ